MSLIKNEIILHAEEEHPPKQADILWHWMVSVKYNKD